MFLETWIEMDEFRKYKLRMTHAVITWRYEFLNTFYNSSSGGQVYKTHPLEEEFCL